MWRVGAWFGASLLFYLLFSLPMSYLKRNMLDHVNAEQMKWVRDGEGGMIGAAVHAGPGPAAPGMPACVRSRCACGRV